MDVNIIEMVIVNLPNFVGLIVAAGVEYKIIMRLLDKLDHCDCDPVDKEEQTR